MNREEVFNCLDPNTEILGHKVLQASAGTGKTFAIEHIFLRLILKGISIEKILVVTFTNAATNELKQRVYSNLEKAENILRGTLEDVSITYLHEYIKDPQAMERINEALFSFDKAQIFTIHSFCSRMLSEFSFEASLAAPNPDEIDQQIYLEKMIHTYLLYGLDITVCLPSQISCLMKKVDIQKFLAGKVSQGGKERPFEQIFYEIANLFASEKQICENLIQEFEDIRENYKKTGFAKEDFSLQLKLLSDLFSSPTDRSYLDRFLFTRGTILKFLSEKNQKKRIGQVQSPLACFAKKLKKQIDSLLDINQIADHLIFHIKPFISQKLKEEQRTLFDDFLKNMQSALDHPPFYQKVKSKYQAVIIDEFQDTDPIQWDVFKRLFVNNDNILSFYLVGDPKQSIYAFRKADIYTYLQAAKDIGKVLHLDTNYRSDQRLVNALNVFFKRDWMYLPKSGQTFAYHPVKSVLNVSFQDIHKPLHFMLAEDRENLEEELFFPYICSEIKRLHKQGEKYSHFAVLVKDRYQEQRLISFFKKANIPSRAKIKPLKDTLGFQVFIEIFHAIKDPKNRSKVNIALANLFSEKEIHPECSQVFYELNHVLLNQGVERCLSTLFSLCLDGADFFSRMKEEVSYDFLECVDLFLSFLNHQVFTNQLLEEFIENVKANSNSRALTQLEESVQVLTIHKSKGLEYEIVFCLGLAFSNKDSEFNLEEILAEKLRQQYVGLTRAKKKVYAPVLLTNKANHSPMELFLKSQKVDNIQDYLEKNKDHFSFTHIPFQKVHFSNENNEVKRFKIEVTHFDTMYRSKKKVLSFSSIAKPKHTPISETKSELPHGVKTGVVMHKLLEKALFHPDCSLAFIEKALVSTPLEGFENLVYEMVHKALYTKLGSKGFCLKDVDKKNFLCETDFFYPTLSNYFKGAIDLIFKQDGLYYLLDWKTNVLPNYHLNELRKAMEDHDYFLQAAIYAKAMKGAIEQFENKEFQTCFGGAFYIFLRGIVSGDGVYHFVPDLKRVENV